jgi:hypothetical protein
MRWFCHSCEQWHDGAVRSLPRPRVDGGQGWWGGMGMESEEAREEEPRATEEETHTRKDRRREKGLRPLPIARPVAQYEGPFD